MLDVYVVYADYCHAGYNADCVGAFLFEHATTCTVYFVAYAYPDFRHADYRARQRVCIAFPGLGRRAAVLP